MKRTRTQRSGMNVGLLQPCFALYQHSLCLCLLDITTLKTQSTACAAAPSTLRVYQRCLHRSSCRSPFRKWRAVCASLQSTVGSRMRGAENIDPSNRSFIWFAQVFLYSTSLLALGLLRSHTTQNRTEIIQHIFRHDLNQLVYNKKTASYNKKLSYSKHSSSSADIVQKSLHTPLLNVCAPSSLACSCSNLSERLSFFASVWRLICTTVVGIGCCDLKSPRWYELSPLPCERWSICAWIALRLLREPR
jgi:hypothetical protein